MSYSQKHITPETKIPFEFIHFIKNNTSQKHLVWWCLGFWFGFCRGVVYFWVLLGVFLCNSLLLGNDSALLHSVGPDTELHLCVSWLECFRLSWDEETNIFFFEKQFLCSVDIRGVLITASHAFTLPTPCGPRQNPWTPPMSHHAGRETGAHHHI